MSGKRAWTDEQLAAIRTHGCGLLVSAAAGSGKTSVLAERCAFLVCDASDKCSVNQLLVVTFTEAAAAEMKERIAKALRDRLAGAKGREDLHLRRQIKLVEHANISTLHGFCLRLVRAHFHRLGLDPAVRVLDPDEGALMRADVVRQLFLDRYEAADPAFTAFVEAYGEGNDEGLMLLVLRSHDLMESLVDPTGWRADALRRLDEAATKPLGQSALGKEYLELVGRQLEHLGRLCEQASLRIPRELTKYVEYMEGIGAEIETWRTVLRKQGYDALVERVKGHEFGRLPTLRGEVPGKEKAKAAIDRVRDAIKHGPLSESLRFTADEFRAGLAATRAHADAFLSLVDEFATRYAAEKRNVRAMDFADLERFALQLLRDGSAAPGELRPSAVARTCHEQFRHVLVDEYQDINAVQEAILRLASTECLAGREREGGRHNAASELASNLFCVGDVKQSIYRFRLADPERFLSKAASFREPGVANVGRVIDLKSNFRSRGTLLGAINGVFERLMTEAAAEITYDDSHALREGASYPTGDPGCTFVGSPIEMHVLEKAGRGAPASHDNGDGETESLERTEREAMLMARRIRKMMGLADGSPRMCVYRRGEGGLEPAPINYSDIVILLRATAHKADEIADVLRSQAIPVYCDRGGGFFDSTEIRDMLALLSVLDNAHQDVPLAAVLRSPLAGLAHPEDVLARVRLAYRDEPFHRAARRYADERADEIGACLKDFFAQLASWRDLAHRRPLAEVIWTVYDKTGYLAFCAGLEDGKQRQANLHHFHQRARQFGAFSRQGLYRFLRFLQQLQRQQETSRPAALGTGEDAVRILSIHASKGLEFPVVFVPDLGKQHNLSDTKGSILIDRAAYLGLSVVDEAKQIRYPSLAQTLVKRRMLRLSLAEELRLLYVAMTRAKEHLVLIGTHDLSRVAEWAEAWGTHTGAMPPEDFAGGRCMLDWIGPAAAMLDGAGRGAIAVQTHDEAEMGTWATEDLLRPTLTKEQQALARLEPLEEAAVRATEPRAQHVIDRLGFKYPHEALTGVAAVRAVSALTKEGKTLALSVDGDAPAASARRRKDLPLKRVLPLPKLLEEEGRPEQTDVGYATHLVLQYVDFGDGIDEAGLAVQINSMITRRLISPAQARWVDVDSILWLTGTPVGAMLRKHSKALMRELPFHLAAGPAQFEPKVRETTREDGVMLRGRVDVLVPTDAGLVLLDYKTDRVTPEQVEERTEVYAEQLKLYRQALARVTGKPLASAYLVYLHPRVLREV